MLSALFCKVVFYTKHDTEDKLPFIISAFHYERSGIVKAIPEKNDNDFNASGQTLGHRAL
jgi:hypothetical protein